MVRSHHEFGTLEQEVVTNIQDCIDLLNDALNNLVSSSQPSTCHIFFNGDFLNTQNNFQLTVESLKRAPPRSQRGLTESILTSAVRDNQLHTDQHPVTTFLKCNA